jgi:YD repeat-containing protein
VVRWSYDNAGRLASVADAKGGVTTYGYDGRGNRTSVTDAKGRVTTFEYDLSTRLVNTGVAVAGRRAAVPLIVICVPLDDLRRSAVTAG